MDKSVVDHARRLENMESQVLWSRKVTAQSGRQYPLTQESFAMKIRPYKPPISPTAKPFRAVRRLQRNPTYMPIKIGPVINTAVIVGISATATMSGFIFGFLMYIAGL